jgi:hypothetical protein
MTGGREEGIGIPATWPSARAGKLAGRDAKAGFGAR